MGVCEIQGIRVLFVAIFFPRLTMVFAVSVPFGFLAWLGWVVAPHITIAVVATEYYWITNPILCVIAWFIAFAGTGGETKVVHMVVTR